MRRWALAGFAVVATLLAAILGLVWLSSNAGCAVLTLERADGARGPTPEGEPLALDETKVRRDAPRLAALLDRALAEGSAKETQEDAARAMHAYLRESGLTGPLASWRGTNVRVLLAVC